MAAQCLRWLALHRELRGAFGKHDARLAQAESVLFFKIPESCIATSSRI